MGDLGTVVWKETREQLRANRRELGGILGILVVLLLIDVYLPLQIRVFWISIVPALLTGPMQAFGWVVFFAADTFAGERERHTLETVLASRLSDRDILLGKVAALLMLGVGLGFAIQVAGLLIVTALFGRWETLPFTVSIGAAIMVASLFVLLALALIGVLISVKVSTVKQAQQLMMIPFLLVFLLPTLLTPALARAGVFQDLGAMTPQAWTTLGLGVFGGILLVDALLFLLARGLFQRHKLLLA